MNHDHLREELDLDLEEMLAPAEKARLESHLASCADCRKEYVARAPVERPCPRRSGAMS